MQPRLMSGQSACLEVAATPGTAEPRQALSPQVCCCGRPTKGGGELTDIERQFHKAFYTVRALSRLPTATGQVLLDMAKEKVRPSASQALARLVPAPPLSRCPLPSLLFQEFLTCGRADGRGPGVLRPRT